MYARYRDKVDFYAVYIREAHPSDGWSMESNDRVGITVAQPKTAAERNRVAAQCCSSLELAMPMLVDGIDDAVGQAYSAFPDRLYLLDRDGKVAYKGGRGPYGYKPRELEQTLVMMLLDDVSTAKITASEGSTNEPNGK
jgi:Iodothyronine deiodinase